MSNTTSPKLVAAYCSVLDKADLGTLNMFKELLNEKIEQVSASEASGNENNVDFNNNVKDKGDNTDLYAKINLSKIEDYVSYSSDLNIPDNDLGLLGEELGSLPGLKNGNHQSVHYFWLSNGSEPYEFGRKSYRPWNIKDFLAIDRLRESVSQLSGYYLDSCLISYYHNNYVSGPAHSDNEDLLEPNSPMCNVSIGPPRPIQFSDIKTKVPLCNIMMAPQSLLTMEKGCQENLLHQVLPSEHNINGPRFCLSFRKLASGKLLSHDSSPDKSSDSIRDDIATHEHLDTHEYLDTIEHLVVGDSLTRFIKVPNTVTLTKGGAHPKDIIDLIDENLDSKILPKIKSVSVMVGTNPIGSMERRKHIPLFGNIQ